MHHDINSNATKQDYTYKRYLSPGLTLDSGSKMKGVSKTNLALNKA